MTVPIYSLKLFQKLLRCNTTMTFFMASGGLVADGIRIFTDRITTTILIESSQFSQMRRRSCTCSLAHYLLVPTPVSAWEKVRRRILWEMQKSLHRSCHSSLI